MKIFGIDLFSFKGVPKDMYDFAQHGLVNLPMQYIDFTNAAVNSVTAGSKPENKPKKVIYITPKGLYHLKALNAHKFAIKTEKEYLDQQLDVLYEKLELLGKAKKQRHSRGAIPEFEGGPVNYGRMELESIIERLKNRANISYFADILKKYPHTTNQLIGEVLHKNNHLRCEIAKKFVPDFPKEAIDAMKEYNDACIQLCNKKTHFYVIAQAKDFKQVSRRRDPILLAQSPFGFFWQILGAWDEEMQYLDEL